MAQLGTIPQMLLPVMMTLTRGNPSVKETVNLSMNFESVALDADGIKAYTAFCGFQSGVVPASWLYCLAQRAQIRLMLESGFPLPAPGMVHITNGLELLNAPDVSKPVSISASAEIPGKPGGSLFPQFTVEISQGATKIAHITSGYIVKRGGGDKAAEASAAKTESPKPIDFSAAKDGGKIVMPDSIGWDYAKVSGDFNPIHIAGFAAKAFGLPGKLVHGWYSVSMFASVIESIKKMTVKKIDVQFAKPVMMPTTVNIEYLETSGADIHFRITSLNKKGDTVVHLTGSVA